MVQVLNSDIPAYRLLILQTANNLCMEYKDEVHTFSVSLPESNDRQYALLDSRHLGTIHHEVIVTPQELWDALPETVYFLESFDRSLVRSAVVNFFLAKLAAAEVKVVLIGEGADELFAGYSYVERFHEGDSLQQELWYYLEQIGERPIHEIMESEGVNRK